MEYIQSKAIYSCTRLEKKVCQRNELKEEREILYGVSALEGNQ